MENCKYIDGFNDYKIYLDGRVKSFKNSKETFMIGKIQTKGYRSVKLFKKNVNKSFLVHRLVALAFIPNPENKPQVNHINGIKTDNRVENLEWCTNSENQIHSFKTGLNIKSKGENQFFSKLKEKDVIEIRNSFLKNKELSNLYNVNRSTIYSVINRTSWKHI